MEFKMNSIVLRKPKEEDARGFIDICSERETMKYYGISGADIDTYEKAVDLDVYSILRREYIKEENT